MLSLRNIWRAAQVLDFFAPATKSLNSFPTDHAIEYSSQP